MTQGFKPLKRSGVPGKQKAKSAAVPKPKVGKKIAAKKHTVRQEVLQKKRNTALSTDRIEREMAGRAQKGPLSIMRALADQSDKGTAGKKGK
ncbi:hypothetical protein MSPP1_001967 [Malassezia sp. CBS 17886]|nr:hypothetical protein MSPP1_001967 [Malassezia sp. CBS 17886]